MLKKKTIDSVMATFTKAAADLEAIAEQKADEAGSIRNDARELEARADMRRGVASAVRAEGAQAQAMATRIKANFGLE